MSVDKDEQDIRKARLKDATDRLESIANDPFMTDGIFDDLMDALEREVSIFETILATFKHIHEVNKKG